MPNDVTWQSTGPLPQRWFACAVSLTQYLVYVPISTTKKHLFFPQIYTHTHTQKWEGAVSEWALILPIWMAYQCNFSKHTSQILLMPSKTPGGTLAYTSVYTLH